MQKRGRVSDAFFIHFNSPKPHFSLSNDQGNPGPFSKLRRASPEYGKALSCHPDTTVDFNGTLK